MTCLSCRREIPPERLRAVPTKIGEQRVYANDGVGLEGSSLKRFESVMTW